MNKIFELIKKNSSNEEYVIGDALLELFPIVFIKPSGPNGRSIQVCGEASVHLGYELINSIKSVEDLASENDIIFSHIVDRNMIGSHGLMRPTTGPELVERSLVVPTITQNVWQILSSHYSVLE